MLHLSPGLTAYVLFLAAVLGMVLGSFAACAAGRIAAGEDFVRGRSHCDDCGHLLAPLDLIPVFSYLISKGKCRYCGAKIPVRCPLTELLCGGAFVAIVLRYELSVLTAQNLVLTVLLLMVALIDYDTGLIPDSLVAAMCVNFLLFSGLLGGDIWRRVVQGFWGGLAAAVPLLLVVFIMDRLLGRESMGGGDIKLFFAAGLYLSWKYALFFLIVSCILGIVFALLSQKTTGDPENPRAFPFGPAIAAGAFASLLAAEPVTAWYLSLF